MDKSELQGHWDPGRADLSKGTMREGGEDICGRLSVLLLVWAQRLAVSAVGQKSWIRSGRNQDKLELATGSTSDLSPLISPQ